MTPRILRSPCPIPLRRPPLTALFAAVALLSASVAGAQSLRPSRASLDRQNAQARLHDFTYIRTPAQVDRFVRNGWLVKLSGNANYSLKNPGTFPYARPEVKLFIERLSRQYRSACGEKLVVTSLTRPKTHQPRNASPFSVHPTGMAMDLRRSRNGECRSWLQSTLLYLEGQKVLEASYERYPPHFHLALFPQPYKRYVDRLLAGNGPVTGTYRVAQGDNLWKIARRHKTTVGALKRENRLRSDRIRPGQVLRIPAAAGR